MSTLQESLVGAGVASKPNPNEDGGKLLHRLLTALEAFGVAYLWKVPNNFGQTCELHLLDNKSVVETRGGVEELYASGARRCIPSKEVLVIKAAQRPSTPDEVWRCGQCNGPVMTISAGKDQPPSLVKCAKCGPLLTTSVWPKKQEDQLPRYAASGWTITDEQKRQLTEAAVRGGGSFTAASGELVTVELVPVQPIDPELHSSGADPGPPGDPSVCPYWGGLVGTWQKEDAAPPPEEPKQETWYDRPPLL